MFRVTYRYYGDAPFSIKVMDHVTLIEHFLRLSKDKNVAEISVKRLDG